MRHALIAVFCLAFAGQASAWTPSDHHPRLLVSAQRLKRLKRERERQTPRWINFENRIKTVPDSPERGFELALYTEITGEPTQAAGWATDHPCERRQVALIRDALGEAPLTSPAALNNCPGTPSGALQHMRDALFETGNLPSDQRKFVDALMVTPLTDVKELYAAAEILTVLKETQQQDVRDESRQFFNSLPVRFLLNLKPQQVEHPDWMTHIAALALVGLDPNSDSAQFLQGWAIEDRQMLHDGPGVAYEMLWADPYLPGVGYQNLDPWWYDEANANLLARSDWSPDACSINISVKGLQESQCPNGWQTKSTGFGHLLLLPMVNKCVEIPPRTNLSSVILWHLPPNGHIRVTEGGRALTLSADKAGLWRVPSNVSGRPCTAR